jgi:hypothetical protein
LSLYHKRDGTTESPVQLTEPTHNQVGEKGAALQIAQPRNGCCYMGAIAYPKSWYDCLFTLQTANPETVVLYGSDRLSQELVRSFTMPNKRCYLQKQIDRLLRPTSRHLQIYNSIAYPKSGMIDYFAPRAAQSIQQLIRLP